ncbi:hypothetical protein QE364_003913 [Nocardioides zeae]|uniref:Uncharacterized protein n=1 Tax=Nocardioides zeae TaxID=1457234 RepID=A0ACC6INT2_9ACTN|nr:hypothetical protein [Nocardioides zeae]MDR6212182.1 hypothetical protein [Nocardioides zeae]
MAQTDAGPARYMQGIAVPASSVNPTEFFARTRRKLQTESSKNFAGLGQQDVFQLKKSDIIAGLFIRFVGSVTSTPGTGTVATTARWPYDLIRAARFTANGQANLINVSGLKLKVRDFMAKGDLTDRGIAQSIAGQTVTQGTLSQASESWGVGSRATAIAGGTYDLDLEWFVPVAEDQVDLAGSIFAQTSSTDLTLTLDWATAAELFTLTGNATAGVTGQVQIIALRYSVPLGADGQIVVPDLSIFHSLIQTRHSGDLGTGENEVKLIGQGSGKTLLRVFSQLWNGTPAAPVPVHEGNFGRMAWRYGSNETPDELHDGQILRFLNERYYNVDIGRVHGFWSHEFAVENAFRDVLDMGTTSELRQVISIDPSLALSNAALEVVQETIFAAGQGS